MLFVGVVQTLHCGQPSFSGCRFLHLELAPWVHRQRIYSTVISTSSENFPVPTFISGHSSVVNIFSGPCSNDDYLGHSKNHDWLIDWLIEWLSEWVSDFQSLHSASASLLGSVNAGTTNRSISSNKEQTSVDMALFVWHITPCLVFKSVHSSPNWVGMHSNALVAANSD